MSPDSLCSVCHIPSSKRQHDAADYARGRQAGGAEGSGGGLEALLKSEGLCGCLSISAGRLSGLKTSRPEDRQAGKVEAKCPN